jgi:hypothetical protein
MESILQLLEEHGHLLLPRKIFHVVSLKIHTVSAATPEKTYRTNSEHQDK